MTQEEAIQKAIRETTTTMFTQLYVVWHPRNGWCVKETWNVASYQTGQRPGGRDQAATHLVTRGKVCVCEDHWQ